MNEGIFRAYDVRGRYPKEINKEVVSQITLTLSRYFSQKSKRPKIIVARDGRIGSAILFQTVIRTLKKANSKTQIVKVGLATTPMFYFLVNRLKASGGIIITASHNPKNWNGLKVMEGGALIMPGKKILKVMKQHGKQIP